jgi:hypothetical protein
MPIKVSKNEWMALSAEQQTQIAGIIDTNFAGQTIEPAEGGTAIVQGGSVCEIACDVAQSAAHMHRDRQRGRQLLPRSMLSN